MINPPQRLIVTMLALMLLVGSFVSCSELSEEEAKQVNTALRDTLISTTESWNMTINLLEKGNRVLRLKGRHATTITRSDTQITRIDGPVKIHIYDSSGAASTRIESQRARYYSRQSEIKLYEDVQVNTRDNKSLRTKYLRWNQSEDRVTSDQFVIFTSEKDSITGHGFTGTLSLSDYSIHNVSGHFTREQEQDTSKQ